MSFAIHPRSHLRARGCVVNNYAGRVGVKQGSPARSPPRCPTVTAPITHRIAQQPLASPTAAARPRSSASSLSSFVRTVSPSLGGF